MRVTLSTELLRLLEQQKRRAWHDMITLDESWFYFRTDHELIWLAPGETIPERGRHTIQSPRMMVTIAWNTNEFYVLADLPKGVKFSSTSYTTEILPHILEWRRSHGTVSTRKLIVHADNARPHTARSSTDFLDANGMKKAPHPSYSADLTPSDFYLFGDVKRRLSECVFNGRDELLSDLLRARLLFQSLSAAKFSEPDLLRSNPGEIPQYPRTCFHPTTGFRVGRNCDGPRLDGRP
jgi:hypothetical protein